MKLYKTVEKEASASQIIEKSKFITYVKPVSSKEEADAFIAEIRKKHKDATHNVPAMVIGDKMQLQWASDDGEPQGTSGAPMVKLLTSEEITDTVIVVTRYFGGIKLGTGGLVRAYTSSAKMGLESAGVCGVYEQMATTYSLEMQANLTEEQREVITGTSQICTMNNQPIYIIEGDPLNFKLTTDGDLLIFKSIIDDQTV